MPRTFPGEASAPRRCLVVVPSLTRGGAERQAVLVASALRDCGVTVRLFVGAEPTSLFEDGLTGSLEVELPVAGGGRVARVLRLRRAVESFLPHAVITFMGTAHYALARSISEAARDAAWIIATRGNAVLRRLAVHPGRFAAQVHWHRQADRIVTNSSALAANLFAIVDPSLSSKVVVVPNIAVPFAFDPAAARARVEGLVGRSDRLVIGCLGSFQADRNYLLAADALPQVLRAKPGAHLLVVGRTAGRWYTAEAEAFRARIAALGLQRHVTLVGELANGRLLLAGVDVFALPSRLEGSSNALAEAMIAGAATATVPVADAWELVGDAGVFSRGWTPSAFAEAILAALEDAADLRVRAAARGRELLRERGSEAIGKQWAGVVEEAVAASRSRRTE